MTRSQLRHLLTIAERDGVQAALAEANAADEAAAYEGACDELAALDFERAAYGNDDDPVCSQDDEFDSRGVRLRPRVNDAGEPWWM